MGMTTTKKINLNHLYRMTDSVGILEHSIMATPDLREGYCLDDNARALQVALRLKEEKLIDTYLKFVVSAIAINGFKNDLTQSLVWQNKELGENFGRAMGALAETGKMGIRNDQKLTGMFLFDQNVKNIKKLESLRSKAWLIYGLSIRNQCDPKLESELDNYIKVKISQKKIEPIGNYDPKKMVKKLADDFITEYKNNSDTSWCWFEDKITYDNGRLPWALFWAYSFLRESKYLEIAKESLDFLLEQIYDKKLDCFSFAGYKGWISKEDEKALYGQQPIEAGSTVEVCNLAYQITKDKKYKDFALRAFEWYHGKNILGAHLVNQESGGIHDGLEKEGVNLNQGAESLLSYLLARLILEKNNSKLQP